MTNKKQNPSTSQDNKRIASGAGKAFIGRLGALIEAFSMIAFTWAYGAVTFGLFAVLWSFVKIATALSEAAMTTALQRFVPRLNKTDAAAAVGHALKFSFLIACLFASVVTYFAPHFADLINAGENDRAQLVDVIRLYVWVLPFWTLIEVGTAAIRALRTFGPEIKIRIFYEQGIRLIAAMSLAALGYQTFGLFAAHLISVILSAALTLNLIAKYYDFWGVIKAPILSTIGNDMRHFGFALMPANIIKKLFSEFPVILLNMLLPGAAGAAASGYYAVARKIASALQVVRLTFEYVMAPLASEKHGEGDIKALSAMYSFSMRLSVSIAMPLGAALIMARSDILATMDPSFIAASSVIFILCFARTLEALTGPSSALIEMLGHRFLPAFNSTMGFLILAGLGVFLIPHYGLNGAAIAAAIGLNVTAILSFLQCIYLFKLNPFDRDYLKVALISATSASLILIVAQKLGSLFSVGINLLTAFFMLCLALWTIMRYGLNSKDRAALGRLGKIADI